MNRILIFDFDGVVVNTFDICLQVTRMYSPEMTPEMYKSMFTGNIFESIKKMDKPQVPKKKIDYFLEYEKLITSLPPIKGIETLLGKLTSKPIIVTSTTTGPVHRYLVKNNLRQYFDKILGSDIERSKIIKLTNVLNENVGREFVFITDTLGDILEARKVGIPSIAVTWGFHDKKLLETGNPISIVDSVEELAVAIAN